MDLEEQRRAVETSFLSNLHPDDAPRHPLYAALCDLAGQTPQVIDMMLEVEPTQRRAVLFLAVLHDMALREPAGPVGGHYPTAIFLAGLESGMDVDTARDTAAKVEVGHSNAQAILQFALDHDDELIDAMRVRRTQTNEVGRSGLLMLGLQVIGRGEPTALIDLGCSAGLNLVAPSYRHVRTDGVELGEPTSKVVVPVDVRHGRGPTAPVDLAGSTLTLSTPPTKKPLAGCWHASGLTISIALSEPDRPSLNGRRWIVAQRSRAAISSKSSPASSMLRRATPGL